MRTLRDLMDSEQTLKEREEQFENIESSDALATAVYSAPTRARWFELALVLSVSFVLPLTAGFYVFLTGRFTRLYVSGWHALYMMAVEVLGLAVMFYVLSRRFEGLRFLGLQWSAKDIVLGLLLCAGGYLVETIFYDGGWYSANFAAYYFPKIGLREIIPQMMQRTFSIYAIPFFLLNPFFEELIVRAFLMREVAALTKSWKIAILASASLQAAYHLYYGWLPAFALWGSFLFMSLYYARTRKILPIIVAHAVADWWPLAHLIR